MVNLLKRKNMRQLPNVTGFDWDQGNERKSHDKHGVSKNEAEQLFFNIPMLLLDDIKHSTSEPRFHALGKADAGRLLHVSFTLRDEKIRVISARDMHKKERSFYEENT